ncbi:hypothetical protein BU26DRAFT_484384 [Trematosphaeria pertusa]|uniref:Uncharacterized protein n=1 Tax=Trematosphaeria pertusa TaxID=390896 RepID=A0A6A6IG05_9PLEO|nr:uncharacterized protein BU26DRAFT_484384 [Trematosphaeria pertusa]KAF2249117.1 hypothetical protein BU26DRAFT_484384 [Trematosphaeria pertusa]
MTLRRDCDAGRESHTLSCRHGPRARCPSAPASCVRARCCTASLCRDGMVRRPRSLKANVDRPNIPLFLC